MSSKIYLDPDDDINHHEIIDLLQKNGYQVYDHGEFELDPDIYEIYFQKEDT